MKKIFYLIVLTLTLGVASCTQNVQPNAETTCDSTAVDTTCVDTIPMPEIPANL